MNISKYSQDGIQFVEVTNNLNLKVIFANLGASIFKINYDNYALTRNVKNPKDFFNPKVYYGKTIGRVASRIRGNSFKLGNQRYVIETNENGNILHGGPHGVSFLLFNEDVKSDEEKVVVTYSRIIRESEDGFPGDLNLRVRYTLYLDKNEIDISYAAKANKDTTLSLTNHTYFTLGCRSIKGLTLSINSDYYLKLDDDLFPIEKELVTPAFDFRQPKRIIKDIESPELHGPYLNGYDVFYYINNKDINNKMLTLSNAKFKMDVYSDFEGVQIYTSGFDAGVELYPKTEGVCDSIAIEPSDSYIRLLGLRKDQLYSRNIKYIFGLKE